MFIKFPLLSLLPVFLVPACGKNLRKTLAHWSIRNLGLVFFWYFPPIIVQNVTLTMSKSKKKKTYWLWQSSVLPDAGIMCPPYFQRDHTSQSTWLKQKRFHTNMACSPSFTHIINTCLLYKNFCSRAYEVITLKFIFILWRQCNTTANLNYRPKKKTTTKNLSTLIISSLFLFSISFYLFLWMLLTNIFSPGRIHNADFLTLL